MADEEEDPTFEEENEEIGGGAEGGQGKRKRLFSKELRCMMYGFGDDQNPYTESVDILEDLVIEFITEMTHKAMSIGRQGRVQVEDIVFLIRKDPRKFNLEHLGVGGVLAQGPHHVPTLTVQDLAITCSVKQLEGLLEFCRLVLGEVTHLDCRALPDLQ
ncbi:transcription initiation factor TFIID subunit 13 [Octodon degus]|uniref:Transcription initiation factor TFIID subunit 13 n=1 Tax=Octodon degus TaxID=10160 RepID=A0A6P6EYP9_OCTDE|nr:transcription initiation factor TFIID subunit 13 [Octodon degus]